MCDKKDLLIIGVSGVTCGGKTTLASALRRILPKSKIISQDDYFRSVDDPHHVWIQELNHINFDIITSLDMEKLYSDVLTIIQDKNLDLNKRCHTATIPPSASSKEMERYILSKSEESDLEVLIIEGFCIFNYKPLLPFFHLKYYFTLCKEECKRRRDKRVYEPPDCPGYFEKCVWPEHLKQLEEVQKTVEDVKFFNGHDRQDDIIEHVMIDLLRVGTMGTGQIFAEDTQLGSTSHHSARHRQENRGPKGVISSRSIMSLQIQCSAAASRI